MMKHSYLSLMVAMTMSLTGCELYFGNDHSDNSWSYCGQDGYYQCDNNDCYWQGSECPAGTDPNSMTGYQCKDSTDCAAGCYCANGTCEEAGFCTVDADCGNGYFCNTQRSSCEPTNTQPEPETSCVTDADCKTGSYCSPDTYTCTATCTCTSDASAVSQNFAYCDESRSTCLPGIDPAGDCTGTVTCNLGRPACPEGQVALISDGCYTGQCEAINSCSAAPGCAAFTNESDCQAATTCSLSYTGVNCHNNVNPNISCTQGAANCVCDSYVFASCSNSNP